MKLEPLTPAEQAVAAENHYIVERFLASKKLPPDEWYDVVVFRYLRAAELWFPAARPVQISVQHDCVEEHGFRSFQREDEAGLEDKDCEP